MFSSDKFSKRLFAQYQEYRKDIPSIKETHDFTDDLINFLFPIKANRKCDLSQIELNHAQLQINFKNLLYPLTSRLEGGIDEINDRFFKRIPEIYEQMLTDVKAYMDFDPAAKSPEGIILYYPGFYAITVYRLAHELYKMKIPFVPRMISEYAHDRTGIDINPGAEIGAHFLIDHGTGVVIGETAVIGNNVKIYQGVTLGALYVGRELKGKKRHPTIEDKVIIYSNTTILGGDTVIGKGSIIGGNIWLTESVDAGTKVLLKKPELIYAGDSNK